MGVVGRLDQYGSMLTSEFDEITANNPSVTGLGTYYSSEFNENIVDIVRDGLVLNLDAGNTASYPGSGTTWTDISGSGNTGTLVNGPTYSSANGGSIVFDGSNDFATIPNSSSFDFETGDFTVESWIRITSLATYHAILEARAAATAQNYIFGIYNIGGTLRMDVVTAGSLANRFGTTTSVPLNTWAHVVWVRSGGIISYYVNTIKDATTSSYAGSVAPSFSTIYVGAIYDGFFLNGNISTIRIYKGKGLTAAEISQNYNALKNRFEILTPSSVTSGLVLNLDAGNPASYPGSGTTWTDLSGNGNNGTLVNGPTYSSANGGSIVFDGVDDYVTLPTNLLIHETGNPFTFSIWFKTSSTGIILGQTNTSNPTSATGYVPAIYVGTNGLLYTSCFWGGAVSNQSVSSSSVNNGSWNNITVTFASNSQISYLNGVSYATLSKTQTFYSSTYYYFLGSGRSDAWASPPGYFNGSIANTQIYNRALSAAEVTQNYNSTIERFLTPLTSNFFMRQNRDKSVIVYNEIDEIADIRDIVRSGLVFDLDAGMNTSYPGFGTTWNDISSPPISAATGALPIYNTTDIYGATKGIGTRIDTNASSLVLAIPMDGANNGTTFTDESATIKGSGTAKTITVVGNTKTLTAQSKYYGSSGFFDGNGDLLTIADTSDLDQVGDFTHEGWYYRTGSGVGSLDVLFYKNVTNYLYAAVDKTTNKFVVNQHNIANVLFGTTVTVANTWYHVAIARQSGTVRLFVNGVLEGSLSNSTNTTGSAASYIGGNHTGAHYTNGYLQDLRIYKGVAKYTANFTPPGNPTNSIGTLTNGPTYSSANGGSIVFDGTNDYAQSTITLTDAQAEGDLTYEYWVQPTRTINGSFTQSTSGTNYFNAGSDQGLANIPIYKQGDASYAAFQFCFGTNGFVVGAHNTGYAPPFLVDYQSYTGISHLIVIKSATGCSYYINGVFKKSASQPRILGAAPSWITSNGAIFGSNFGRYFQGNIFAYKLYNRALSADEITQNFNALRNRYGL